MSIIHEALKKVQNGLQTKVIETTPDAAVQMPPAPETGAAVQAQTPAATAAKPRGKLIFLLVLLMLTTFSAVYLLYGNSLPPFKAPNLSFPKVPHITLPSPKVFTKPAADPVNSITLHGIMSDQNGNLALVNDKVYAEGGIINGAKIIKINTDSIVILKDGKEEKLLIKR